MSLAARDTSGKPPPPPGRKGTTSSVSGAAQSRQSKTDPNGTDVWFRASLQVLTDVGLRASQFAVDGLASLMEKQGISRTSTRFNTSNPVSTSTASSNKWQSSASSSEDDRISCTKYELDLIGKSYGDCVCGLPRVAHSSEAFKRNNAPSKRPQGKANSVLDSISEGRSESPSGSSRAKPNPPKQPKQQLSKQETLSKCEETRVVESPKPGMSRFTRADANRQNRTSNRISMLSLFGKASRSSSLQYAVCGSYELDMEGATFGDCKCGRPRADHSPEALKKIKSSAPVRAAPPNLVIASPGSRLQMAPSNESHQDITMGFGGGAPRSQYNGPPKWVPPKPDLSTKAAASDLRKYEKMHKCGVPRGAIENAMIKDGLDPSLFDFEMSVSDSSTSVGPVDPTPSSTNAIQSSQPHSNNQTGLDVNRTGAIHNFHDNLAAEREAHVTMTSIRQSKLEHNVRAATMPLLMHHNTSDDSRQRELPFAMMFSPSSENGDLTNESRSSAHQGEPTITIAPTSSWPSLGPPPEFVNSFMNFLEGYSDLHAHNPLFNQGSQDAKSFTSKGYQ